MLSKWKYDSVRISPRPFALMIFRIDELSEGKL